MTDQKIIRRKFFRFALGSLVFPGICGNFLQGDSKRIPSALLNLQTSDSSERKNNRSPRRKSSSKKTSERKGGTISLFDKLLVRKNPKKFRMEVSFDINIEGNFPDELNVVLPVPQTNEYQIIEKSEYPQNGIIRFFDDGKGLYLLTTFTKDSPFQPFNMSYDVTLCDIYADWSRLQKFYDYDRQSDIYRRFTGKKGSCVDPNNPQIKELAEDLGKQSKNPLEYAHRAYLYVSDHFQYCDPQLNMIPLTEIFKNGGGHCGNLTSIYVSLLRAKGIPARHLVGKRPGLDTDYKSCHIWSDFYLENYGWIPVDISQRVQSTKKGDWFGRVSASTGMIVQCDTDHMISLGSKKEKVTTLQNYYTSWRFSSNSAPQIKASLIYKKI